MVAKNYDPVQSCPKDDFAQASPAALVPDVMACQESVPATITVVFLCKKYLRIASSACDLVTDKYLSDI